MTWPPAPETLRYLLLRFSQVFPFSCPIFGRELSRLSSHGRYLILTAHRIIRSALANTFGGIVRPICWTVAKLSWTFAIHCITLQCTGRNLYGAPINYAIAGGSCH